MAVFYLAKEADVETKCLRVPRASVHVVANQQYELQKFTETFTLLHLFTGKRYIHDVWPDVIDLFFKRQLKQNAVETWS